MSEAASLNKSFYKTMANHLILALIFSQSLWADVVFNKTRLANGELGEKFSFEDLKGVIEKRNLKTVEDVIASLPSVMRSNHVLVYSSRSLQEASPANPRAILFGSDASFMLSFNGAPNQRGYQAIEALQFRNKTATFELHEMTFTGSGVQFSGANPIHCMGCHGRNPRPNWDGYFLWPGVYGSEDDHVYRTNPKFKFLKDQTEEVWFKKFTATKNHHPRYKHLIESNSTILIGDENRPASLLSHMLGRLNAKKIAQELADNPHLDPYQNTLIGLFVCSRRKWISLYEEVISEGEIHQWISSFHESELRQSYKYFLELTLKEQNASYQERLKRHRELIGSDVVSERVREDIVGNLYKKKDYNEYFSLIAALRYLNQIWKIDMTDWSMEFSPRSYVMNTPGIEFEDVGKYYAQLKRGTDYKINCSELKKTEVHP